LLDNGIDIDGEPMMKIKQSFFKQIINKIKSYGRK